MNEKDYVLFFKVGGFSNSGKIFVLIVLLLVQYSTFIWEMSLRHFWCSIGVTRSSTFESSFQLLFSNMNIKVRIESSLEDARTELSPADRVIVSDLWQELQAQA